jgi:CheY-like chemotaxis protein
LFSEPDRWWSISELSARADTGASSARSHIASLAESGLICRKREHGKVWFRADSQSPVFPELYSIVMKLTTQFGATILVVEDQPATARITSILLESRGYRVLEVHHPEEALRVFGAEPEIDLLLSDIHMPDMSGTQLAGELLKKKPGLRVVLMSGDVAEPLPRGFAFLQKPFNPNSLARAVRRQLERPARMNGL